MFTDWGWLSKCLVRWGWIGLNEIITCWFYWSESLCMWCGTTIPPWIIVPLCAGTGHSVDLSTLTRPSLRLWSTRRNNFLCTRVGRGADTPSPVLLDLRRIRRGKMAEVRCWTARTKRKQVTNRIVLVPMKSEDDWARTKTGFQGEFRSQGG
jgi:hypothetical protein